MEENIMETKTKLVRLLKKHGYHQDERPDHREWMKYFDEFSIKIRLDQNNPDGFNGFQFGLSAYMRYGIKERQVRKILEHLNKWYETQPKTSKTKKASK